MKKLAVALLASLILAPVAVTGLEIASVYPTTVVAGAPVTLVGGPFDPNTRVVVGDMEVSPLRAGTRQLVFIAPPLEPGEYALYLISGQESSEATFSLRIVLPPPQVLSLEPANIDECSTIEERTVLLEGRYIQPGASLLLGGQVIPSTRLSDTGIRFTAPVLRSGSYGVQVANPDGSTSLAHSLWFNNIPQIDQVSIGEDFVNYYQLIIRGKNFFHNSTVVLNEYPVGLSDIPPRQKVIPGQGGAAFQGDQPRQPQSEAVFYVDCNTLIYNRYPYSGQPKTLILRVSNPDGKQSGVYEISAP